MICSHLRRFGFYRDLSGLSSGPMRVERFGKDHQTKLLFLHRNYIEFVTGFQEPKSLIDHSEAARQAGKQAVAGQTSLNLLLATSLNREAGKVCMQ